MYCEYCYKSPHHPRCPNAQQPEEIFCCECGKEVTYEDQYEDSCNVVLCAECLLMLHRKGEEYNEAI